MRSSSGFKTGSPKDGTLKPNDSVSYNSPRTGGGGHEEVSNFLHVNPVALGEGSITSSGISDNNVDVRDPDVVVGVVEKPVVPTQRGPPFGRVGKIEYAVYVLFSTAWVCYLFYQTHLFSVQWVNALMRINPPMAIFEYFGSIGIDTLDNQWRVHSSMLHLTVVGMGIFVVASRIVRSKSSPATLQLFYVVCGVGFIAFLHGPKFIFTLLFLLFNYLFILPLESRVPFAAFYSITWVYILAALACNERYNGYSFGSYVDLESAWDEKLRWHVVFNMSVLRIISFNYDMREARWNGTDRRQKAIARHDTTCVECAELRQQSTHLANKIASSSANGLIGDTLRCYKYRTDASRPVDEYNIRSYFAYTLYLPLFVAGPIISFNAFASYCCEPTTLIYSRRFLITYAMRAFMIMGVLITLLHFDYVNALRNSPFVFPVSSGVWQLSAMYMHLAFLWLKFAHIWRLFRLIALLDGVEPPENMRRCFMNLLTIQDFWRDWHSSFNQWVVRYMYIPMGGNKTRFLNIFPIFFFIAFWHGVELHLLHWALVICSTFLVEILIQSFFNKASLAWLRAKPYYRFLQALGGMWCATALLVCNVLGFGSQRLGNEGNSSTWDSMVYAFHTIGLFMIVGMGMYFFCAASIGLMYRERERTEYKAKYQQLCVPRQIQKTSAGDL